MVIEKKNLLERTRERWPLVVRVTPKGGVPSFDAEPCLVEVYRTIQESSEPKAEWTADDEWKNLANWSFHQALWKLADQSVSERHLHREEVTFDMFDEWMRFNLSEDCWSAERDEYEESPLRFQ